MSTIPIAGQEASRWPSVDLEQYVAHRVRDALPMGSLQDGPRIEELRRRGVEVLSLRGAPVLPMPPHILEEAASAAAEVSTYPPLQGLSSLREAVADMVAREEGQSLDPDTEVLITNGGMQAAYTVFTALLNPGDELILPVPAFFFDEMVKLVNGNPVLVPMDEEEGYRLDVDRIERAITSRTKAVLLNTPQNPTGYVSTLEDLDALARIAERHDLLVIADESFRRFTFDGRVHRSMISHAGIRERTVVLRSFTKTFALQAWRIGYILAPPQLLSQFTKAQQWMTISVNYVSQRVAEAAITGPQEWLSQMSAEYQRNREYVVQAIDRMDRVWCVNPQGLPLLWLNISALGKSGLQFHDEPFPSTPTVSLRQPVSISIRPHPTYGSPMVVIGGHLRSWRTVSIRLSRHAAKPPIGAPPSL